MFRRILAVILCGAVLFTLPSASAADAKPAASDGSVPSGPLGTIGYYIMRVKDIIIASFGSFARIARSCPAVKKDGAEYTAALIADLHADADPTRDRTFVLRDALTGMTCTLGRVDALVLAGDMTNCGDEKEYLNLKSKLRFFVRAEQILPEMGNHDAWHHSDDPDYPKALRNFTGFCRWCGIRTARPYYSWSDDHCNYIAVGSESNMQDMACISDAQFVWLKTALNIAARSGKPIVFICHQPLDGHNGGYDGWADEGVDGTSARLEKLLEETAAKTGAPVLHVSGHRHRDFGENSFEDAGGGLYFLNLPSFEYCGGNPGAALIIKDGGVYIQKYLFGEEKAVGEAILLR